MSTDNLFSILERYVGIVISALWLIRSYLSDRTQRVHIDCIMFDIANLLSGLPQGPVLGPTIFGYLLLLGELLRHHNNVYHIYADDTQLNILFKCEDPLESLIKLRVCISDIRVWMLKRKIFRINHNF